MTRGEVGGDDDAVGGHADAGRNAELREGVHTHDGNDDQHSNAEEDHRCADEQPGHRCYVPCDTVRLCYALRRGVFYPSTRDEFGQMPPRAEQQRYLPVVKGMGFDAVEVGVGDMADQQAARDLASELADAGLAIGCVRAGGGLSAPFGATEAAARLERAVRLAGTCGASVVNTALVNPPTNPGGPGAGHQRERVSQGSSRVASEYDYEHTAERLRQAGAARVEDVGVKIAIEVHQGSIADNSWATLHLLDLVGLEAASAPILTWEISTGSTSVHEEETPEAAMLALAPRAVYWHCKNLQRTHIPELQRSFFARVPLPDGEIDYRFALSAMLAAGYEGYFAVEGAQKGDQLSQDRRERGVRAACRAADELSAEARPRRMGGLPLPRKASRLRVVKCHQGSGRFVWRRPTAAAAWASLPAPIITPPSIWSTTLSGVTISRNARPFAWHAASTRSRAASIASG